MRLRHAGGSRLGPELRNARPSFARGRAVSCACAALLALFAARALAEPGTPNAPQSAAPAEGVAPYETPPRLAISVFAESDGLGSFAERVKSWFQDGTVVTLERAARNSAQLPPAALPGVVTIWVILLSNERALVTFSMRTPSGGERHLVREVRLRNALDELGLERLASVIQSNVVALREGFPGSDLETLKTELESAGFHLHEAAPVLPATSSTDAGVPSPASTVIVPERSEAPPPTASLEKHDAGSVRGEHVVQKSGPLHVDVSYGARYAGRQLLLHGPGLGFGWPFGFEAHALWLLVRASAFLPASVAASPFRLSLQTSSVRAGVAFERRSRSRVSEYAALLAGVDVVRIGSRVQGDATTPSERYEASQAVTRVWAELGLAAGIWVHGAIDVGIFGAVDFCSSDVRYVVETSNGDGSVLSPWRVQPGLFVTGRFGVTPSDWRATPVD